MTVARRALVIAAAIALSGCFNLKYYSTSLPGPGETHRVWVHAFLYGAVTIDQIDLDAECPAGVYKLKSNHTLPDILLAGITFGVYTPMNLVITCADVPPPVSLGPVTE